MEGSWKVTLLLLLLTPEVPSPVTPAAAAAAADTAEAPAAVTAVAEVWKIGGHSLLLLAPPKVHAQGQPPPALLLLLLLLGFRPRGGGLNPVRSRKGPWQLNPCAAAAALAGATEQAGDSSTLVAPLVGVCSGTVPVPPAVAAAAGAACVL
jgi:hypothetical protein